MTFLPVVTRELSVAARKRSTFWVRVAAALFAVTIGCVFMFIGNASGAGLPGLGRNLFGTLTWLGMAVALSAGLFFTSDCLSEEKREGTLGFLFLTDLRGFDVVLGKLMATSLRGMFALLAVVPILAVTLLMGGVTGWQFWKTSFALFNALFASLAAGILISAISRDPQRALAGTALLLLLVIAGAPVADWLVGQLTHNPAWSLFSLASPFQVFLMAGAWGHPPYGKGLLLSFGLSWLWLGLASVLIPRTWQEKVARKSHARATWSYRWRYGGPRRRAKLRGRLIARNPVLWLACRERWQSLGIWLLAMAVVSGFGILSVLVVFSIVGPEVWVMWNFVGGMLTLVLYLWAASQASRFFLEARRSGLVELLLGSPLTVKEIVQGQWRALVRMFGVPVILLLGVQLLAVALSTQFNWASATRTIGSGFRISASMAIVSLGTAMSSAAIAVANLLALFWFGMWMGMTSKTANFATLKTIVFVQVLPWFVIMIFTALASAAIAMGGWLSSGGGSAVSSVVVSLTPLLFAVVPLVLNVAKAWAFIYWSRRKLYSSFREEATRSLGGSRIYAVPPPIPIARPAPPPIPASP